MSELESLDSYKSRLPSMPHRWRFAPTGVACPKCGSELVEDTMIRLPSNPPKRLFRCESCGNVEYV